MQYIWPISAVQQASRADLHFSITLRKLAYLLAEFNLTAADRTQYEDILFSVHDANNNRT